MKKIIFILLAAAIVLPNACFASKAEDALEYCKQAMQLDIERQPGGQRTSESKINSMCAFTEHTAETWECVVRSMKDNEYSMSQALNDCSCKK